MDIYATAADLDGGAWLPADVTPDSAAVDRALKYATIVVARACNRGLYTDDTVFPPPLVDATCAQAASWLTLGFDPGKLGLDAAPVKKSSILGADVERDTSGVLAANQAAVAELCSTARDILMQAGLLWQAVPLSDDSDLLHYGLSGAPLGFSPLFANSADAWPFW